MDRKTNWVKVLQKRFRVQGAVGCIASKGSRVKYGLVFRKFSSMVCGGGGVSPGLCAMRCSVWEEV